MPSDSPLSSSTQNSKDKDADDVPGKGDEGLDQERTDSSTQDINTVGPSINTASTNINTGSLNINTVSFNDTSMPSLEETGIFDKACDDEDVGAEADLNNLETTMNVSLIPTTRIHKDHPKDQIIRDINLAIQTRRMINFSKENAMVWTLVDLPKGKRAIGTKWVYINKKDDRGIVVRNKARLVAQASKPDIMFAVCACARFQVTPKVSHLHAVKMIFRYLKGQPKLGFWYPIDSPFDLEAFSNSDYVRASLDRKSTTGGCQFLGKRLISWRCKKQTIIANSTTEAEYVAAVNFCRQVLWI
ncbi:putative ribonuclease H-like domain-containing protein [Tanacetum coccineum]